MNASFCYKNRVWILQPPNVAEVFQALFQNCKPDLIIEIGTKHGGLTTVIEEFCSPNADVHTYDINDERQTTLRATFHLQDVFKAESDISKMISKAKTTMLICDGGDKLKEFQTFSPYLKKGDFILAHDFTPNTCEGWQWKEISEEAIAPAVKGHTLVPFMADTMASAAWCCYQKV